MRKILITNPSVIKKDSFCSVKQSEEGLESATHRLYFAHEAVTACQSVRFCLSGFLRRAGRDRRQNPVGKKGVNRGDASFCPRFFFFRHTLLLILRQRSRCTKPVVQQVRGD